MNKQRRKALDLVIGGIESLKNDLENLKEEEETYYDNMPESIQSGEKGDVVSNCITSLEEAIDQLDSAVESITEAVNASN